MDIKNIKELISVFEKSEISFLEFDDGNSHIKMKKPSDGAVQMQAPVMVTSANTTNAQPVQNSNESDLKEIKSPVVGIFYSASSPENPPFVQIGQMVTKGEVVGLIEAMKVMNEIKAPADGIIREIRVKNEQIVAFGDVLMRIEE